MGPRLDSRGRAGTLQRIGQVVMASMGPRLDSRGRHPEGGSQWHGSLRFNGAAAGQPRKVHLCLLVIGAILASMGPRLDSRGRESRKFLVEVMHPASMGPRLDSRGRLLPEQHRPGRDWASMGPRLDSRGRGKLVMLWRSRELASMGPRLDSRGRMRGRGNLGSSYSLQWGRGWTAAEGEWNSIVLRVSDFLLQWGRGWTAAEGTDR